MRCGLLCRKFSILLIAFVIYNCTPKFDQERPTASFNGLENKPLEEQSLSKPHHVKKEVIQKGHQYFFPVRHEKLWSALLSVLLGSYNLSIVDKQDMIITTDWDTYFEGENLLRNKVSIRLTQTGYRSSTMTLINNEQQLSNTADLGLSSVGTVWIPKEKEETENKRILKHLTELLSLPLPRLAVNKKTQRAFTGR